MFDYSQLPLSEDGHKKWDKIFTRGIMDVGKPLGDCHYSQGGKYICTCKSNICKKGISKK